MSKLLRLIVAVAFGSLAVAGTVVTIPTVLRGVYRHASTTVARPLPALTSVEEQGSTVYAANGSVLANLRSSVTRVPVPISKISPILIAAVIDTEDARFYGHGGVDFPSLVRAALHDTSGAGLQGGSTLTQQLVKQVYLNSERTLSRKIKEAVLANRLQKQYTKNQILDAYLNTIYLGSGAYGVEAASEAYWGEHANQLRLSQAALLAGLIQDPSGYDPVYNPSAARVRRSEVLQRMLHYHTIDEHQYKIADAAPLPTSARFTPEPITGEAGYYVEQVVQQLLGSNSPLGGTRAQRIQALYEGGLKIYTNYDPAAEARAAQAVAATTPPATADAAYRETNGVMVQVPIKGGFQEDLVAIDPTNGNVDALYAGPNYAKASFDVATQGLRQAGSGFKIFTLLAFLEHGGNIYDHVDASTPCGIPFPGNDAYVKNPAHNDEGDGQQGVTTVLNATAQSLNCAYLRMAHQIGLPAVVAEAEKLGIPASEIAPYKDDPSMVIGTAGVTPLQMADAYATLASGGYYHAPQFISRIENVSGQVVYKENTTGQEVIPPNIVAEADVAFEAVVQNGTCTAAAIPGRQVAGKTGTTSGPTDSWFNGYTPNLETTVWMGYPQDEYIMRVYGAEPYGATYSCPAVHDYMSSTLADLPVETFPALDNAILPPLYVVPTVTGPTPPLVPPTTVPPPVPVHAPPPPPHVSPTTTPPRPTTPTTSPPTTSPPAPKTPPGTVPKKRH